MNLLVDTHAFIWIGTGDSRIAGRVLDRIADPDNQIFLSVVSRWEIELKRHRRSDYALAEPFDEVLSRSGFLPLPLEFDVPSRLAELPRIHSDPFDRILVAQAIHHELTLVTGDLSIRRYSVPTLW
ncbi:MAG TPA: type II toxin-antitoxin system VapC family toxin [Allosphingosinicella sp.]|nr:type II toxin-antitoxin system VapC family toxin [Allosphingosinicella sp.]